MSKSGIYVANTTPQTVAEGGTIALGSTVRRYGCNFSFSGNTISVDGVGYYKLNAVASVVPSVAGTVQFTALKDGIAIVGATSYATSTETTQSVTLPITAMFKKVCPCVENESNITFVLKGGAASVENIAVTIESV